MAKHFRLVTRGPGPDAARAIASAKSALRRHDLRAVVLITVSSDGVGTLYGGAEEGFFHHLVSGTEMAKRRIIKDAE